MFCRQPRYKTVLLYSRLSYLFEVIIMLFQRDVGARNEDVLKSTAGSRCRSCCHGDPTVIPS